MKDDKVIDAINLVRARKVQRGMKKEDGCHTVRKDHGVKGMKWGEHKAKEEEKPSAGSKSESKSEPITFKSKEDAIDTIKLGYRVVESYRDGIADRQRKLSTLMKQLTDRYKKEASASELALAESPYAKKEDTISYKVRQKFADKIGEAEYEVNRMKERFEHYNDKLWDYQMAAHKQFGVTYEDVKHYDGFRKDYGVKGMKWGEHKAKEEESGESKRMSASAEESKGSKPLSDKVKYGFKNQLDPINKSAGKYVMTLHETVKKISDLTENAKEDYLKASPKSEIGYGGIDTPAKGAASHFKHFNDSYHLEELKNTIKDKGFQDCVDAIKDRQAHIVKSLEKYTVWNKKKHRWEASPTAGSGGASAPKTEVSAAKAKASMQAKAQKEADRIGTSTQKIKDDLYVAFLPDSYAGRPPIRAWGKIVDKPTEGYKEYGWDGNFKIYSKGFWGTGDNPSFGYEFVLDDSK